MDETAQETQRPGPTSGLTPDEVAAILGLGSGDALLARAAEAGLPPAQALDARGRLSLSAYFRLMRWLAPQAGRETFDLSSRPTLWGTKELVYGRAAEAERIEGALRAVADTYNLVHGGPFNRVDAGHGRLTFTIRDDGYPYTRADDPRLPFVLECTLLQLHAAVCEMAGRDATPFLQRLVTRRPAREGCGAEALEIWPAPVTFGGDVYALSYDAAVGALPVVEAFRRADHALAVHTRTLALAETVRAETGERLVEQVRRALADGLRRQEQVAQRLGVSPATLRRRLAVEDRSFRTLLHAQLMAEARRKIAAGEALDDVAAELGFSDVRAFRRAFKAWTGVTPGAFRGSARGAQSA